MADTDTIGISPAQTAREVPLEFTGDDAIPTAYATNMVVNWTGHEFVLQFYEARPPVLLGTPEQMAKQLESTGRVYARCVARVVISESRMPRFVKVLQDHLSLKERKAEERSE